MRMSFLRAFDRHAAGLVIFAGFLTLAYAAQGSVAPRVIVAESSDAPTGSERMPIEQEAAQVLPTTTSADSICAKQNWPYYSKECLRGGDEAIAPRQVHLHPRSAHQAITRPFPTFAETAARKPIESRQVTETPRRRKLHQAPRYASPTILRPQQIKQESARFEQPLAFTW